MSPARNAVDLAVRLAGGQSEVARHLGIRQQSVSAWVASGLVPPSRVRALVELVDGQVSAADLNPPIFGWQDREAC